MLSRSKADAIFVLVLPSSGRVEDNTPPPPPGGLDLASNVSSLSEDMKSEDIDGTDKPKTDSGEASLADDVGAE